jgi:cob(I)alamin adenosyltransferase
MMPQNTRKKNPRPKLSTGTGDTGTTGLFHGGRVSKTDPQIIATGDCDELSAALGMAKAATPDADMARMISLIQQDLVTIMGDISLNRYASEPKKFSLEQERLDWLEESGATLENQLAPQTDWELAGENPTEAALQLARTICRRAERSALTVPEPHRASKTALLYLNRLSDTLMLLGRDAGGKRKKS